MISVTEDEMKKTYPNEDLHDLKENRICFSLKNLEFVLYFNQKQKKAFVKLCREALIKKSFKSLDFYDANIIIYAVVGRYISKVDFIHGPDPEKIKFSVESAANFTFQKIDENENLNEIQKIDENKNLNEIQKMGGNEKLNEKIRTLEKRLNNLEIRMDKFEKKNSKY